MKATKPIQVGINEGFSGIKRNDYTRGPGNKAKLISEQADRVNKRFIASIV